MSYYYEETNNVENGLNHLISYIAPLQSANWKKEDEISEMFKMKTRALKHFQELLIQINDAERSERIKQRFLHSMTRLQSHSNYFLHRRLNLCSECLHERVRYEAKKRRMKNEIVLIMTALSTLQSQQRSESVCDQLKVIPFTADKASCSKRQAISSAMQIDIAQDWESLFTDYDIEDLLSLSLHPTQSTTT